jgi:hypothetical protein
MKKLTNQEKLEQLNNAQQMLSQAWCILYDLDTHIDGEIPAARMAVNKAQCRVIEAISTIKVKELRK